MDKLKMHTPNKADENFKKLAELFPNAITETIDENGEVVRAIDKDVLMQEINTRVVDGKEERYQFTWPDKKKSVLLANAPIAKTLRPCREESVGKDGTPGGFDSENLYIEGDNLEVLKLLQETYLGKIKMIYIDPPYNTGNDFVYEDDFAQSTEEYLANSGQFDDEGNRLVRNLDSNGRFHTDWLNMLYPRLRVAKDLLVNEGAIFISIDINEQQNLRKMCDEIFGEKCFVTDFIWNSRKSVSNDAIVSLNHNYTLVYTKSITHFIASKASFKFADDGEGFSNPDNDPRGPWKADPFDSPGIRPNLTFAIINPNTGVEYWPPEGRCWRTGEKEYLEFLKDNRIVFGKTGTSKPQLKRFYSEAQSKGLTPKSLWDDCGTATDGTKEILDIFKSKVFDTPKPTRFIKKIIDLAAKGDAIILDFFSGSATTAHAVMQLNAEDGGNRKFIMVQIPEATDEKSEAHKAGYKNICEIGKERIRRVGAKIQQDRLENIGTMRHEWDQTTYKIEETVIAGKKVFSVADGFLIACFDENVTDETIIAIAKQQPYYFVMRDSSLANDSVATNFEQIFATYSPDTVKKVL